MKTRFHLFSLIAGTLVLPQLAFSQSGPSGVAESLKRALEAQGWVATETAQGTVYHRRAEGAHVAAPEPKGHRSGAGLEDALRARGWSVDHAPDGSLLLYPPRPTHDSGAAAKAGPEAAPSPGPGGLRHWSVRRTPDGGWLFTPQAADATTATSHPSAKPDRARERSRSAPERATGHTQGVTAPCPGLELTGTRVDLPVNTWSEARRLARAWVRAANLEKKATVGRIREILEVYLVSIVTRQPPYRLLHQLAIRRDDGHLIVLN